LTLLVIGTERHISFQGFGPRSEVICALLCLVGFCMAALTPKKRTIYDLLAGTLVVKKAVPRYG